MAGRDTAHGERRKFQQNVSVKVQISTARMSESDEESVIALPKLYKKAANAKRSLTRAKKEFQNALKALREAASSQHFFEELLKAQELYKDKRIAVFEIYDAIEDEVSEQKFEVDFGRQTKEIERDFDVLEEEARLAISAHHTAVTAINTSPAAATTRRGEMAAGPRFKLEPSFEPKPALKVDMSPEEVQNWERQFHMYYDISALKNADMATQRAVILNCLHPELQMKVFEALSGVVDIKTGLAVIREEIRKRHPRVVRRHNLFSLEQKKDEYKFSDTLSRLDTLAKEAELTDMSKDSILCHLMLRACRNDDLRGKMLEVEEDDMTVARLKEVVERFETIQATNHGLGERETVKRAKAGEGNTCYRCQERDSKHFASSCPVPATSLFCRTCSAHNVPLPHSHNFFPGCKGKKKEDLKEKKVEEKGDSEVGKSKRTRARNLSPAGDPESSDSEEEKVHARRVTTTDVPAGSPSSTDNEEEEDALMTDSGWASSTEEDDGEEDDIYFASNADFVQLKLRSRVAADPETSWAPADSGSQEKGLSLSAVAPRGRSPVVVEKVEQVAVRTTGRMPAACCNPKLICAITSVVVLLLLAGFIKWINAEEDTTTTVEPKVAGDNNQVAIRTDNKHEISLLHIDNLASSQRMTNGLMIGGFVTMLSIAAFIFYNHKKNKILRRGQKTRERFEMMDKIQAVEDEMVNRGFMPKRKMKKTKRGQKKKNKVRRSQKKETDIEAKEEQNASSSEDSD